MCGRIDYLNKAASPFGNATSRRCSVSLAVTQGARAAITSSMMLALLAGCGRSSDSAKSDVIVKIDGAHHACLVALNSEAQANSISCDDVVSFVRDELRLPKGSIYDMRTIGDVDAAQKSKIKTALDGAGYRSPGGR